MHTSLNAFLACKAVGLEPAFLRTWENTFSRASCVILPGKKNLNPSKNKSSAKLISLIVDNIIPVCNGFHPLPNFMCCMISMNSFRDLYFSPLFLNVMLDFLSLAVIMENQSHTFLIHQAVVLAHSSICLNCTASSMAAAVFIENNCTAVATLIVWKWLGKRCALFKCWSERRDEVDFICEIHNCLTYPEETFGDGKLFSWQTYDGNTIIVDKKALRIFLRRWGTSATQWIISQLSRV